MLTTSKGNKRKAIILALGRYGSVGLVCRYYLDELDHPPAHARYCSRVSTPPSGVWRYAV
jgi:hypothetical protein